MLSECYLNTEWWQQPAGTVSCCQNFSLADAASKQCWGMAVVDFRWCPWRVLAASDGEHEGTAPDSASAEGPLTALPFPALCLPRFCPLMFPESPLRVLSSLPFSGPPTEDFLSPWCS